MDLAKYIPEEIDIHNLSQADFPRIAKDKELTEKIKSAVKSIPTNHQLVVSDSCGYLALRHEAPTLLIFRRVK